VLKVSVAVKADNEGVDTSIWAVGGPDEKMEKARQTLRVAVHYRWYSRVRKEAREWLRSQPTGLSKIERSRNKERVEDVLRRLARSYWCEWKDGSRLLFWQWPEAWQVEARDGENVSLS
jgi:hypothetical protein